MSTISVFGLGYVGVVTAACFAKEGHNVIGVDVSQEKVDMLNAGFSPIVEDQIGDLVKEAVESGKLKAYSDAEYAVNHSDIIIICVGTPSARNGALDTGYIVRVCEDIGSVLKKSKKQPLIVLRSTMLPGSMENVVIPTLEKAVGAPINEITRVIFHPEFLREGSSVYDFYNPPKIVVGESENGGGEDLMQLYTGIDAPRFIVSYNEAEMVKYCDNMYHALKVTFANEIGQFCYEIGVDSHEVMKIFISDRKLNISEKYLTPGFAFGGSCLPKDLRAFNYIANANDAYLPMLASVLTSNKAQIERAAEHIISFRESEIGFFGLSFKKGTDDLRESPLVTLIEMLIGKGIKVTVFDEFVNYAKLLGGNKSYINERLPHISELLLHSVDELAKCRLIVLGHKPGEKQLADWMNAGIKLVDLNHPGGALYSKNR